MIFQAREIILSMHSKDAFISESETTQLIEETIQKINNDQSEKVYALEKDHPFDKINNRRWNRFWQITAAASIILLIGTGVWVNYFEGKSENYISYVELVALSKDQLVEKINDTDAPQTIELEDGSRIILEKKSRISFPESFSRLDKREIYLSGEATFKIAKNRNKPFFVYANGLITKVLGTVFTVRSEDAEEKVTVEVQSGIVSVYSLIDKKSKDNNNSKKLSSIILTRNQKVVFSNKENSLITAIVDKPVLKEEEKLNYYFNEVPIKDVFKMLESGYGIDIIYDEIIFSDEKLTANLSGKTLYEQLDIICKATNARYELTAGKIVIYSSY